MNQLNSLTLKLYEIWHKLTTEYNVTNPLYIVNWDDFDKLLSELYGGNIPDYSYKYSLSRSAFAATHESDNGNFVTISSELLEDTLEHTHLSNIVDYGRCLLRHEVGHLLDFRNRHPSLVDYDRRKYALQIEEYYKIRFASREENIIYYYTRIDREFRANSLVGLTAKAMVLADNRL